MEIIVNTMRGTFMVPTHKADQLIAWLEANAVKQNQRPIGEIKDDSSYTGRQLINE